MGESRASQAWLARRIFTSPRRSGHGSDRRGVRCVLEAGRRLPNLKAPPALIWDSSTFLKKRLPGGHGILSQPFGFQDQP